MEPQHHGPAPDGRPGRRLPGHRHPLAGLTRLLYLAVIVAVITLAAGATAPATRVFASEQPVDSIGLRLLDAPVDRRDDPRARAYIVDHMRPGESIARRIEVMNTTSDALDVHLYPAGARLEDGNFQFFNGREGNELTTWTRVEPSVVRAPAGGAAVATVHIDVPADAAEGERYAVVWAEPPAVSGGSVAVVNRVGIRVYLSVGAGGEPATQFSITELRAGRDEQGAPQVIAQVENAGGRALDLTGELTLTGGPGGLSAGPFQTQGATTVGVQDTGEVTFSLDPALPAGPWDAEVTLLSGTTQASADATLTFPDQGQTTTATPDNGFPWWLPALALALFLLLFLLLRRRTKERTQAQGDAEAPTS